MLLRVWFATRLAMVAIFFIGLVYFVIGVLFNQVVAGSSNASWLTLSLSFLACALVCTPSNRGKIVRGLGARGKHGSATQQAASVASLIGEASAADVLSSAASHLSTVLSQKTVGNCR